MKDEHGAWIGYGIGDVSPEVRKIEHRLLYAYPRNSHAREHGVVEDTTYTEATAAAIRDLTTYINATEHKQLRTDGVANLAVRQAIGAYTPPGPPQPKPSRYPIQGVWARSEAFLNPPNAPSFEKDTNDFAAEAFRLYSSHVGMPIIPIGYSMGGVSVKKFLDRLPTEWRQFVKMVVTFGDPAMPADGSLLGDDPGEGISKAPQPAWCRDRYYSFSIEGDWYPRARGLLFLLYQILVRAELTTDFAMYLFTMFPTQAFQELIGQKPSSDPLAGVLSGLGGVMTSGPSNLFGQLLGVSQLFAILPNLVYLLFDAVKFIASNAHGKYGDPAYALWDGMTGVDKAAALIREKVPTATLYLFPGTWAMWNQGFPIDVASRLQ
jgi:predicted transcriptional regulator with HTH domain